MKKTKIVTSIGPASNTVDVFTKMVEAGANVARINFSHATIEEREQAVNTVKEVRKITNKNIAILYDTKGPEFRSGVTKESGINLVSGNTIKLVKEDVIGTEEQLTFNHKNAIDQMNVGNIVLLENGLMSLEVIEKHDDYVLAKVVNGGVLYSKKSCAVPGVDLKIPFISDVDREDIIYACRHDGDYLAASFVQSKEDVLAIREILKEQNREDMKIISKIESQMGLDNLESIAEVSDGLMVARGDLGVEVPFEKLPLCQKTIVKTARKHKKICIVATEMLESMKHNPRPTRAEVSDVANAVLNGTDAVMLSGETTTGEYVVETVKAMAKICECIENSIEYKNIFAEKKVSTPTDAIVKSVAEAANSLDSKLIVVPTISGKSAKLISNLEPSCPILALVSTEEIANQLALNYGIYAVKADIVNDMDKLVDISIAEAKKFMKVNKGDTIVITGGLVAGKIGFTNLMKIEEITE